MTMIDTEARPALNLTALDRCDRCGSQALMEASKDDLSLLFCGHHGRAHKEKLRAEGWLIAGDVDKISDAGYTYEDLNL